MSQTPFVLDTDLESVRPNDLFVYSPEQRDISIRSRAEMNDLEITNDGFHVEESEADDFLAELTGPGTLMNFRRGGKFYCESIEAELGASEDVRETISGLEARFDEKGYNSSYFICTNSAEPLPLPQLRDDIGSNNILIELDNHDQLAWAEYDPQRNKLYGYSTTSIDIVEGTQKDLEGEKRTELEQIARNEDLEFSVLKAGNAQYNHSH